jgi:anti-sigma-K factor RskA
MSEHERFAEDLALYALEALTGEDRTRLLEHLKTCASCKLELEQLRGDVALLALSAVGPRPPARAKQRLMDAVAKDARSAQVAQRASETAPSDSEVARGVRHSWWGWLGWAATAAVVVFALSLWKENAGLKSMVASATSQAAENARQVEELRRVAAPLLETDAQRVTLVAAKTPPQPQGKAFYLRKRNSLVFVASNMPALPSGKAYELWLIPTAGNPIAAGVFKPDAHGSGTVVNPPLPAGVEAKAFAITVENEAGSPVPTSAILMVGAGE